MNSNTHNKITKRIGIIVKSTVFKEILSWVRVFVISIAIALFVNNFIIINAKVPSGSMENTIPSNSWMIGLRTSYWFGDPERGDIIIFKYPVDEDRLFTKRVIGLPGETVRIIDGFVYINGELLDEPYLKNAASSLIPTDFPINKDGNVGEYVVPKDSYFCLGDNRANSNDSPDWDNEIPNDDKDYTCVKRNKILGKAVLLISPEFRLVE